MSFYLLGAQDEISAPGGALVEVAGGEAVDASLTFFRYLLPRCVIFVM